MALLIITLVALLGIALVASAESASQMVESKESDSYEKAVFAGGCFWCMEAAFEEMEGVVEVISGYTGGEKENPTYEEVSSGQTGHLEAVEVYYDSSKISYRKLVESFWRQIDPTDDVGQFVDKGKQYLTAIFYRNEEEKKIAEELKKALEESGRFDKPIATQILPVQKFYRAEEEHQDYYKKKVLQYNLYKKGSGRDEKLGKIWRVK